MKATPIVAPTGATPSANSVTASPRNHLLPNYSRSLEPDDSAGLHALQRVEEFASCWWSIFEMLREADQYGEGLKGTLPQWARERLGDWRQQHEAHDEMRRYLDDAKRALALSEGTQKATFEIWTKRGHRLDGQHEYRTQAEAALNELADRYPDAYVCRVHRMAAAVGDCQPDLLDTLIGRIYWAGVSFAREAGEEDLHTVQDSTGRTVTVPTSTLRKHSAFDRMTQDGKDRVVWHFSKRDHHQ